ncbi:FAD:protein FMN transferase [Sinomicrobium sp. FJxs]|uniref:FAD:protein FMN transferase n=2 Tax=Sinomicrobium weinanense TaxID=2842200 RepID=A0A926JPL7_9FLAO|nr:FAD:protein FMN transferase [Sinomicrobium weinanense]MBU3121929.1 FAD:protein FMN transferase [Sinomicrobium weinanense]
MGFRKSFSILVVFTLLGMGFTGCKSQEKSRTMTISGEAQGSTYSIKYISDEQEDLKPAIDSILLAIDMSMSTYRPDSDISRINAGDSTVVVDENFRNVFLGSQKIWKESGGSFDPTIGTLVRAWGFGPDHHRIPLDSTRVDSLLQYCGFEKVALTPQNTIWKKDKNIYFDFNSIAQGYTVDVIVNFFLDRGIDDFIVEVGGELAAHGRNTEKDKNWVVGIDDPLQGTEGRTFIAKININNLGMATSGNYRKTITDSITGEKYVHTVDPKTGFTKKGSVVSTTVLAETCMEADAYATTFMVMDLERSKEFLKTKPELHAFILYMDENNEMQKYMTEGFKALLLK